MISVYKLKPKFQQLLHPLLVWLHQKKVTANEITIVAIVFSLGIGVLFWEASSVPLFFLALPIGLLIRMILNALDGMMAREFGRCRFRCIYFLSFAQVSSRKPLFSSWFYRIECA